MKKVSVLLIGLLLMVAMVLTACGSSSTKTSSSSGGNTTPASSSSGSGSSGSSGSGSNSATSSSSNSSGSNASSSSSSSSSSSNTSSASGYPKRDIQIIVGWGAGGGTDNFSRAIAKPLSKELGVNINVVNKPGASGAIAGDYVTKQPADGYTIWAISSNYPLNVALGKTPHGLSDYIPIARSQLDTFSIQVKAGSKYANIDALIAAAKKNPGKLTIGGTGSKSFDEVNVMQFEKAAGIKLKYIPYSKAGAMHADLLGGHIDAMIEEIGPSIAQIKAGKISVALIYAEKRIKGFENVPVSKEKGWNLTDGQQRGLMVKAGTPQAIVQKLQDAVQKAQNSASYQKFLVDTYLNLKDGWLNSKDYETDLKQTIATYKQLMGQ